MSVLRALLAPVAKRFHPSQDMDWTPCLVARRRLPGCRRRRSVSRWRCRRSFACIRVLGETVAGLPLITYREARNGGRRRAANHPLYRLLRRGPIRR